MHSSDLDEVGQIRSFSSSPFFSAFIYITAILCCVYNFLGIFILVFRPWVHLATNLGFIGVIVFTRYKSPLERFNARFAYVVDFLLIVLTILVSWYYARFYEDLLYRVAVPDFEDIVVSSITILICLELSRRTIGKGLSVIAAVCLAYAFWGQYLPGIFHHEGFSFRRIVVFMYNENGIFGSALEAGATFVLLFVVFGEFLNKFGCGEVFIDLATGIAGKYRGGPAKIAVLSSALFGTIAGSSIANVAATGTFTIPLMKRTGYRAEFAGAVEAAASTGGQIMPPIMGATAFVMAEIVGVPYSTVALAAMLPAILFFFSVLVMVHCEAVKSSLKGLPREALPSVKKLLKEKWAYLLPVVTVFSSLLIFNVSTARAALYGIMTAICVPVLARNRDVRFRHFFDALADGALSVMGILASCAVAGIVIGVLAMTGLGSKLGNFLIQVSGGNLFLILIAGMLLSIVLGMGLPSTPSYIVAVSVVGPALGMAKMPMLTAHLFIFYYAVLSVVTPPIALASYTAAGIARANVTKVGIEGVKLASAAFIVPFMFAYSPALMLQGTWGEIIAGVFSSVIGICILATSIQGYFFGSLNIVQRFVFFVGAMLSLYSGIVTDIAGIGLFAVCIFFSPVQRRDIALWASSLAQRRRESLS